MAPPPLRAAVIGLGVGEQHIIGYRRHPGCTVTALCDLDAERLEAVARRHPGPRLTTDPMAVLTAGDVDVVSIASYDDAHFDQVMTAIGHGKHVFVEKPLCLTEAEFRAIAAALRARPEIRLSSNLILRESPRFQAMRERVRAGRLGRLFLLEGDYNYGRLNKLTDGWRGRIPYYSVVLGGAVHLIDLMLWILEERPVEVCAYGARIATQGSAFRHADTVVAILRFPGGAVAKASANFACVFPHHHNLSLYGVDGTLIHDRTGAAFYASRDPAAAPEPIEAPYPGAAKGDLLPDFVSAILERRPARVTEKQVMDAMAVCLAIDRSLTDGRPVAPVYEALPGELTDWQ